jgi:hypothetical protein
MGWREDVKFGIGRITRLFLGTANGLLGTEVDTDKIIDIANNQVATAAQVDAVALGGGTPVTIVTDDTIVSSIPFRFAASTGMQVPLADDLGPGAFGMVCVADFIDTVRATSAEIALGDFEYAILPVGSGPPGSFSTDPTQGDAVAILTCVELGPSIWEVFVKGPGGSILQTQVQVFTTDDFGLCGP